MLAWPRDALHKSSGGWQPAPSACLPLLATFYTTPRYLICRHQSNAFRTAISLCPMGSSQNQSGSGSRRTSIVIAAKKMHTQQEQAARRAQSTEPYDLNRRGAKELNDVGGEREDRELRADPLMLASSARSSSMLRSRILMGLRVGLRVGLLPRSALPK